MPMLFVMYMPTKLYQQEYADSFCPPWESVCATCLARS